jgi:hypothetical protein
MASNSRTRLPPDAYKVLVPLVGCGCLPIALAFLLMMLGMGIFGASLVHELWLSETEKPMVMTVVSNQAYTWVPTPSKSTRSPTPTCKVKSYFSTDHGHWLETTLHSGRCLTSENVGLELEPGGHVIVRRSVFNGEWTRPGDRWGVRLVTAFIFALFLFIGRKLWKLFMLFFRPGAR